jgi:hypothetical protein
MLTAKPIFLASMIQYTPSENLINIFSLPLAIATFAKSRRRSGVTFVAKTCAKFVAQSFSHFSKTQPRAKMTKTVD